MKKSTLVLFITSVVLLVLGGVVGCVGLALGYSNVDEAIKVLQANGPATISYVMYGVVALLAVVHFIVVLVRKRYSHLAITFVLGFLALSFAALGGYGIWAGEQAVAGKYNISGTYAYLAVAGGVVVALGVILTVITYLKSMLDKPVAKGVAIEDDTKPAEEPVTYNFDEKEETTEVKTEEASVAEEKPAEEAPVEEEKPAEEPVAAEAAVVASAASEEAKPAEEPTKEEKVEEVKAEEKPADEPTKEEEKPVEEKATSKKGEKKVATKKDTAAKKPAAKKTVAAKTTEKKATADKKDTTAKKPAAAKKDATSGKAYHLAKRKEDGKWAIKLANGEKAIKLFDTKEEAMAYAKTLSNNQDATLRVHASKGKSKGKIQKQ